MCLFRWHSVLILVAGIAFAQGSRAEGQIPPPDTIRGDTIRADTIPAARVPLPRIFILDGIVVGATATRGVARYQPTLALEREQLLRRGGSAVGQLLEGEPGVSVRSMGPAPARPMIRGFDGDRVLVLQNGERMGDLSETAADHAVALDPLALERIEVIRGPAGLLYGSSALGGVVNLVDGDLPPPGSSGRGADLLMEGTSGTPSAAFSVRGRTSGEGWGAALRLTHRESGAVSVPGGVLPDTERTATEAALGARAEVGRIPLEFRAGIQRQEYGLPEAVETPGARVAIRMDRRWFRAGAHTVRSGWLREGELRIYASQYAHDEVEEVPGLPALRSEAVDVSFDQRTAGGTLTLRHGSLPGVEGGAVGLHLSRRELALGGPEAFHPDGSVQTAALFLFEETPALHGIRAQFGVRGELHRVDASPNGAFPTVRERRPGRSWSGSAGVNWRPLEAVEVGMQLARAHRIPHLEERYSDGVHLGAGAYEIGNPDLEPELGVGVDFHLRLAGERFRGEIALFRNRVENYVTLTPTGDRDSASGLPVHRYAGVEAELEGGELSVEFRPTRELHFRLGADRVRGSRLDRGGEPLPFIPPARAFFEAGVERERAWVGARVRVLAAQRRTAPEEVATPGTVLTGIHGGFHLPGESGHRILIGVENLFDVTWRDHLSRVERRDLPMPGRTLTLRYHWSLP